LVRFTAIRYILQPFGIFYNHLVYSWPFGIFMAIWYIHGHLVYSWPFGIFMAIWYIMFSFGKSLCCTNKSLTSLLKSDPCHNCPTQEALVVPYGYSWSFTIRPNDLREDRLPRDITESIHWLVSTR
jgi:hypothetical protein